MYQPHIIIISHIISHTYQHCRDILYTERERRRNLRGEKGRWAAEEGLPCWWWGVEGNGGPWLLRVRGRARLDSGLDGVWVVHAAAQRAAPRCAVPGQRRRGGGVSWRQPKEMTPCSPELCTVVGEMARWGFGLVHTLPWISGHCAAVGGVRQGYDKGAARRLRRRSRSAEGRRSCSDGLLGLSWPGGTAMLPVGSRQGEEARGDLVAWVLP